MKLPNIQTKPVNITFLLLFVFLIPVGLAAQQSKPEEKAVNSETVAGKQLLADLKFLSSDDMKGRETGTLENRIARDYIVKRFKESGLSPWSTEAGYVQEFSFTSRTKEKINGANVIGFIEGNKKKAGSIVISAHFDHLGVRNGDVYNGTDDNASGTAALFALAAYFKSNRPEHTLYFVAFDAEEKGLQGARYFVSAPVIPLAEILLNINMDMVSRSEKNELYIAGTFHYPELKPLLLGVAKIAPVSLLFGHDRPELKSNDWTNQSDHYQFHLKKIPFVYFGAEDHPDYHKPTDDFEKIHPEFYENSVNTILMGIIALDQNFKK